MRQEIKYLKSKCGGLFIKTGGDDQNEIEVSNGELKFMEGNGLEFDWYTSEGYVEITREEFDARYIQEVGRLNQFAAL